MARSLADSLKLAKQRQNLILSPRVNSYLSANSDGLYFSEPTADLIKKLMMKKPRDRRGSFSPSSSGYCQRRQVFDFLGTKGARPQSTDLRNLFGDGTWRHLRWQAMGTEDGWFTGVEVSARVPGTVFKGSMDGDNTDEGWFFELKGTGATESVIRKHVIPAMDFLNEGHDPTEVDTSGDPSITYAIKNWHQVQRYFLQTGDRYEKAVLMFEPKGSQAFVEVNLVPTAAGQAIAEAEMESLQSYVDDKRLPAVKKECTSRNSATRRQCPWGKVCLAKYEWSEALPPRTVRVRRRK